jgi:hypothetical protein
MTRIGLSVFRMVDAATGQVQFTIYGYVASVPHPYPIGVGILSGSGLAAPSGF